MEECGRDAFAYQHCPSHHLAVADNSWFESPWAWPDTLRVAGRDRGQVWSHCDEFECQEAVPTDTEYCHECGDVDPADRLQSTLAAF